MKKVIMIPDNNQEESKKPVVFTQIAGTQYGWGYTYIKPSDYEKVVYLGKCNTDGDMFAAYYNGGISIFKGHLNSGEY